MCFPKIAIELMHFLLGGHSFNKSMIWYMYILSNRTALSQNEIVTLHIVADAEIFLMHRLKIATFFFTHILQHLIFETLSCKADEEK